MFLHAQGFFNRVRVWLALALSVTLFSRFADVAPVFMGGARTQSAISGKQHIALLLGGSVRSLVLPEVHRGIRSFVVEELERVHHVHVDVFMCVSFSDATSWKVPQSHCPVETLSSVKPLLNALRPVAVETYIANNQQISHVDPFGSNCSNVTKYANVEASIAHFDVSKCLLRQVLRYASMNKVNYSWFLRSRPDYHWFAPISLNLSLYDDKNAQVVFDASWPYFMFDGMYVLRADVAHQVWGKGANILTEVPCELLTKSKINPEALLGSVAKLLQLRIEPAMFGSQSTFARCSKLSCPRGFTTVNESEIEMCNLSNERFSRQVTLWKTHGTQNK